MKSENQQPTIVELARMHLILGYSNIQYSEQGKTVLHKTISWDDIRNKKEFFIESAKFRASNNDDARHTHLMGEELKKDVEFAKEIVSILPDYFMHFSAKVKKDKEVIKAFLRNYKQENDAWWSSGDPIDRLSKDNRLGVAYEITKEFPEYEKCLGATIKKKLGSMSLVEYVEKKNLQKSLRKGLKKKEKQVMRSKI